MIGYFYIFGTILFTVYGQLILKWRISHYGELPLETWDKVYFLAKLALDPFLLSGFASTLIAAIFWIAAMTKFDISYAYPFMSLAFVLVLILSVWLFKESITLNKILGMAFIVIGIIITSRSV
ncbi:MAG: EamA family transporter [Methylococcaceae bacterium]|nr:EamA family transporter [Methylococcaceae bacterium]